MSQSPRADHLALIQAVAQQRDHTAFTELFNYFAPRVKAIMARGGIDPLTADEIAQETMATVWRDAATFNPRATLAGWIFSIARDLRENIHGGTFFRTAYVHTNQISPEYQVRLQQALENLPVEQAAVIRKAFLEEKTHREIEQELNIPLGTVKSRLRLAIRRLRSQLDDLR